MANRGIFAEDSSDACDYFQRKSFGRKRTRNEPLQTTSGSSDETRMPGLLAERERAQQFRLNKLSK